MSRVPPVASSVRTARRSTVGLAFTGALLVILLATTVAQAAAVTVGFRDFAYDPGAATRATADAQQSKLWFANNTWYGGFYSTTTESFNIYRHNAATHAWADSGIIVDTRDKVHGDYLFDAANNRLYVASAKGECTGAGSCNDAVNLYRFTFVAANPLATQYTLDAGFPKAIIGGPYTTFPTPSTGGAETVTVAKDADRVYVAWTRNSATDPTDAATTSVAYSTDGGPAFGDTMSAPFEINAGEPGQDNVSALVSFGTSVGIYYTDAHASGADVGLFRVHTASTAGNVWGAPETAAASSVDNQASVKNDAAGNVYVAYKTRASLGTAAQISLLKRTAAGVWSSRGVSDVDSANVRAQVAINSTYNGGSGAAFVIMNESELASNNGNVYYKVAPLTGAGALTYTLTGKGTTFIDSTTDQDIEDATTTKQVLTQASGLLVSATDKSSKFYMHNDLQLADALDNTGPVGTIAINNNPTPDATKLTAVTLNISATDPNGVESMRIINSPDGINCPTTGTPALLVGGTTEPYAITKAWTLAAGDAVKRVCIQFLDNPVIGTGNWSVPVSDTIRLDTTGPVGNVTINGGDATTPIANVSLNVTATDATSVANVRISNSAAVDGAGVLNGAGSETRVYGATQPWTLLQNEGVKTVYVQWQDALGTWSGVDSDTITLDTDDSTYTAVTPIRMLDSRVNNPGGITSFRHASPQSFQITGRTIDGVTIPANAVAITGNLSITGQGASGFVSLGPDVSTNPQTSSINFPKGDTRGNGLFVPLSNTGKLEATYIASGSNPGSKTVHLILDVTGYFVNGSAGNEYTPVTPARYADTRNSGILNPSVPRSIQVGGRTVGSTTVPADAVAITGNLSVTGQTKGGYLSLTPTSNNNPSVATLNFPAGDTRGNNFTAKLGPTGLVYVVYKGTGKAHAILDVTGYFRNDDAGGLKFVPLAPSRVVDTRIDQGITNKLQMGTPKTWNARAGGVGSDAEAFTGNVTVVGPSRGGFVSVTPNPNANPSTSTLNFPKGDTRGNGLAAPINGAGQASAVYKASGSASTDFIVDVTGYFHD